MPGVAEVVAVDDARAVAARFGADGVGCIDAMVAPRHLYLSAHAETARGDEDGCGIAAIQTVDIGGDFLTIVPCLPIVVTAETSHADRLLGRRMPHGCAATGTEQEHFACLTVGHDRGIAHCPSPVGRVGVVAFAQKLFVAPGCSTIGRTTVVQLYLTQCVAVANTDVAQLVAIVAHSNERTVGTLRDGRYAVRGSLHDFGLLGRCKEGDSLGLLGLLRKGDVCSKHHGQDVEKPRIHYFRKSSKYCVIFSCR